MKLFILFFFILGLAEAQSNYGDQRARADSDPRTLSARQEFSSHVKSEFQKSRRRHNLGHINLQLDSRMVAQYGRGKESAMKVIPRENEQILGLISRSRTAPRALFQEISRYPLLRKYKREDIAKAIRLLSGAKSVRMSYWGYLGRSEVLPTFNAKNGELKYNARWNEAKSFYKIYSKQEMESKIISGIIEQMNTRSWFEILKSINIFDLCS